MNKLLNNINFSTFKKVLKIIGYVYLCIFSWILFSKLLNYIFPFLDFESIKMINKVVNEKPIYINALRILILAPIVEEFLFRYPIKVAKYNYILLFAILLLSTMSIIFNQDYVVSIFVVYSVLMSISLFYKPRAIRFRVIVSSIIFGGLHFVNIVDYESMSYLQLLSKSVSIIIVGFGLAHIRVKYTMIWAIIGHFLFNILPFLTKLK